jgi:tetratricopeptide (TPR) repeat protein
MADMRHCSTLSRLLTSCGSNRRRPVVNGLSHAGVALSLLLPIAAIAQDDLEFAPEAVKQSGPPSATLQQGLKLYEQGDYYGATVPLHEVVEGKTGDGEVHTQRAEFWLGKTLFHLGYYSAALSYFDRVVQKGGGHRYYNATLKWLASISQKLPESSGVLEKLGSYDQSQFDQPELGKVRSELLYLLGRYHYGKGNFDEAISLFSSVPPDSPLFARAKFMEGVTHVRRYKARPAAEAFKVVLRTAREAPDTREIAEFEQLARMSLARVFYSTKQYDLSAKYYAQIPRESAHWLPSLFEGGWANFMRNNFSQALGDIHTLNAPYFEDRFFPESLIVKAVIYWKNCMYDQSLATVSAFEERFPALKREVDGLLSRTEDPAEFYDYMLKVRQQTAGLNRRLRRFVMQSMSDKEAQQAFEYVNELDRELAQVQNADPSWKATAIAGAVLTDLSVQKSVAQNVAGDLAMRRLRRLSREINELRKQAIKIKYEDIRGKKNRLEASLRNEQVVAAPTSASTISPDDEHYVWPFTGEYWRDELGYYRVKIASRCTR